MGRPSSRSSCRWSYGGRSGRSRTRPPQWGQLRGGGHVDRAVDLGRRRAKPARMAHRCATLLGLPGCGVRLRRNFFLRPRRLELLLPFGFQLPFELLDPRLQFLNHLALGGVLLPQAVHLSLQRVGPRVVVFRRQDETAQRGSAQMRAVARHADSHTRVSGKRRTTSAATPWPTQPMSLRYPLHGEAQERLETKLLRWSVVGGRWSVVGGQWSVVSGQWSVVSGQWSVVSGQWSVVSGQWSVVQWSVVSGQWSAVSGQCEQDTTTDRSRTSDD